MGSFRGGHSRPTFDTQVTFLPVNQTAVDRSGGYKQRIDEPIWGAWTGPAPSQVTDSPEFGAFVPPDDEGHECNISGGLAWFVEGGERVIINVGIDNNFFVKKRAASETGSWLSPGTRDISYLIADANRPQGSKARLVKWIADGTNPRTANLPVHTPAVRDGEYGILIDTAEGQTLITTRFNPEDCLEWTRTYTPADPSIEPFTLLADVKDIAGAERVAGDLEVGVRTKSLVFAQSSIKFLLDRPGSIAKEWKVRIGNREMDIVGVVDGWVQNRYSRLVVEDRR